MGRGSVLAVSCADPVLSLVGCLGLAAAYGTALVVDLGDEPVLGNGRTLADVDSEGPRLEELSPGARGVAVIPAGRIRPDRLHDLVGKLTGRWPAVVLRNQTLSWDGPTVPFVPLYPGWLAPSWAHAAVWQPVGGNAKAPGPGPVLPRLPPRLARNLLNGRMPLRSRWIDSLRPVWEIPWA